MEILDLRGSVEFSSERHVHKLLVDTPFCSISVVGLKPRQASSIHSHPGADEIYHVLEGEGLFGDGHREARLGPGKTVIFPAGEVHRVQALTRMVLYRVQSGADRRGQRLDGWPERRAP